MPATTNEPDEHLPFIPFTRAAQSELDAMLARLRLELAGRISDMVAAEQRPSVTAEDVTWFSVLVTKNGTTK